MAQQFLSGVKITAADENTLYLDTGASGQQTTIFYQVNGSYKYQQRVGTNWELYNYTTSNWDFHIGGSTGYLALGHNSPSARLHLSGDNSTKSAIRQSRTGVVIWDQAIDSSGRLQWGTRASEGGTRSVHFTLDDNSKAGVGIAAPDSKLHVEQAAVTLNTTNLDDSSVVGLSVTIPDATLSGGEGVAIALGMNGRGRSYIATEFDSSNKDATDLVFYTENGGTIYERLRIDQTGFATFADNILLADDKEIQLGAATDFKIYHNSTTNVNHVSSQLDRQLSLNANTILLTNQANNSTYLNLSSSEATFTTDVRLPSGGKLYTWTGHDDNYLKYDLWRASASAGMTIHNISSEGEIYLKSGNALALTLDSSQDATFDGKVDIRGAGYHQIHIANTTSADTNKQSGITTSNYEGNNVSIFQTFQQNNNNTIYFGSADGSHRGIQNYRFYVNTDSNATSGHTEALHIGSDLHSKFKGIVSVPTGKAFRMYNAAGNGWAELTFNESDNKVQFNRGIQPSGNEQADQTLGISTKRWHTVYAHDGNFSGDISSQTATFTKSSGDHITIDGRASGSYNAANIYFKSGDSAGSWNAYRLKYVKDASNDRLEFIDGSGNPNIYFNNGGAATFAGNVTVSGGTLNLGNDVSLYDDGTNILRTDDILHANNNLHVGGGGIIYNRADTNNYIKFNSPNVQIKGHLLPDSDGAYKLGAGSGTNLRWGGIELYNGADIIWANGDAKISEGDDDNYSLNFFTYDNSAAELSKALQLKGDNSASFDSGKLIIDNVSDNGRIHGTSSIFLGGVSTTLVQLSAKLIPDADSSRELGQSNRYWSHGYIDNITTTGNINVDGNGATIFDNSNNNNAWYIRNGGTNAATLQFGLGDNPGANIKHTFDGSGNVEFAGKIRTTEDIGRDDHNRIMFSTDDSLIFRVADSHRFRMDSDNFSPYVDSSYDLGTSSLYFRHGYIDAITTTGDVIIGGDLEVSGITTTTNVVNLDLEDNIIGLNRGSTSNTNDSGLIIERGSTGDNAAFLWDEGDDAFVFGTTTATPAATGNITYAWSPIKAGDATFEDQVNIKRSGVNASTSLQQTGTGLIVNAPNGYHPLVIKHNTTEQYRFANTGYFGIGDFSSTNPALALDVKGTTNLASRFMFTKDLSTDKVLFGGADHDTFTAPFIGSSSNHTFTIAQNGGEAIRINTDKTSHFASHIYGKSVNNESSKLYKFGGLFLTWDSDSYGTNLNHSITSTDDGTYSDSITINSYDKVRINIDSNNNDSASTFTVGHHGTGSSGYLLHLDESGHHTVTGSSRAPIFYDSDDTAYYLDPNSTGTALNVAGDVKIAATKKLYLDGGSNTYIYESSDGVIDFIGDNTHLVSMKQNGTQSEVVVNEASGDIDFRVEANNDTHAFFVEAEASGKIGIGTDDPASRLSLKDGDLEFLTSDVSARLAKIKFSEAVWGDESFYIQHDGSGAGINNYLKLYGDGSGGTAGGISISRGGNVAVGTENPDFHANASNLVVGSGSGNQGITIYSGSSVGNYGSIYFADGRADGAEEYRGMITYEQNNEIMRFHTNTVEALKLDLNQKATFASGVGITGAALQTYQQFNSDPVTSSDGNNLFSIGGNGMNAGYSRNISIWSTTQGSPWRSWVGTNLRWDGTNYKRASNEANQNWGNVAGIMFNGGSNGSDKTITFYTDEPENATGSAGESTIGTTVPNAWRALEIDNDRRVYGYGNFYIDSYSYFGAAFYDQSNTAFLVDPAGTSVVNHMDMDTGNVAGKFAVMSAAVHPSYDLYNNGTTYLNGATIIDDNLTLNEYIYHQGDTDTYLRFETNNVVLAAGAAGYIQLESDGDIQLVPEYTTDDAVHYIELGRVAGSNSGFSTGDNPVHVTVLGGYSVGYDVTNGTRLCNEGFLMWHSGGGWTGNQRHWAMTNAYDMSGSGGPKFALLLGDNNTTEPTLADNGQLGTNTSVATYWKNDKRMIHTGVLQVESDVRSPIFYDSANTAYYVNPNGNSVLSGTLSIQSTANGIQFTNHGDGNSFITVNHSGNENWYFKAASASGTTDYIGIGASGGGEVKIYEDGKIEHQGLNSLSSGTNVDQIKEFQMSFQLVANTWTDTGIDGTDLATGTYAMQVYVDDHSVGGSHYDEYYSGMMSWFATQTNETAHATDEIPTHRAGHAPNDGFLQFRTTRGSSADLKLQVKHNEAYSAALDNSDNKRMTFNFRRLI